MFHRFGLYRAKSLHSFISQTEIHTGPSLGVFETWVRLSYFGAFVNTQVNVRQSLRKNDTFRLFRKVLSATPLHNFCGLVHISEMIFPQNGVRFIAVNDGVDRAPGDNDFAPLHNLVQIIEMQPKNRKIKSHISSKREALKRKSKSWFFQNGLPLQKNYAPEMENPPFTDGINSLPAYPQSDRKSLAALGRCFSRRCYICFVCPLVLWRCW